MFDPKNTVAYLTRGLAREKLNDWSSAVHDYTQVIDINPRDAEAYNHRSLIYAKQGDYRRATADARQACNLGICDVIEWLNKKGWVQD